MMPCGLKSVVSAQHTPWFTLPCHRHYGCLMARQRRHHTQSRSRKASWGCAAAQNWQPDFEESPLTGGLSSNLEQAVPAEQRPVNELAALREAALYSWARLELPAYSKRLALLFLGIFIMFAGPIAFQTFDPMQQPAEFLLSGTLGALVVVAAAVVRIFLGWQYVGNRLLSASVEYEETGWYDGQLFVKPPEVLARDRLLGNYEVKPTLQRLKGTLLGSGTALVLTAGVLFGLVTSGADADGMYGRAASPRQYTPSGVIYSDKVRDLSELSTDDVAAAAEQAAQNGVPGYCADRHLRAAAGGQYCNKFDFRRGPR